MALTKTIKVSLETWRCLNKSRRKVLNGKVPFDTYIRYLLKREGVWKE